MVGQVRLGVARRLAGQQRHVQLVVLQQASFDQQVLRMWGAQRTSKLARVGPPLLVVRNQTPFEGLQNNAQGLAVCHWMLHKADCYTNIAVRCLGRRLIQSVRIGAGTYGVEQDRCDHTGTQYACLKWGSQQRRQCCAPQAPVHAVSRLRGNHVHQ